MIELVTGFPGSGKSYMLVWRTLAGMRRGRECFTNFPVPGAYKLTPDLLERGVFPSGSLLSIDEGGLFFNSRKWNEFPDEAFQLFTQHRKMKLDMLVCGQDAAMIDVQIRRVAQWFWWAENPWYLPAFRYRLYFRMEDIGYRDERCRKRSYLVKSRRVFRSFDSWAQIVTSQREVMEFERWETVEGGEAAKPPDSEEI